MRRNRSRFEAVRSVGGLLPSDLLDRIGSQDADLTGLRPADYHLARGDRLREAITRSWNVLQGHWAGFQVELEELSEDEPATSMTRERWLLPLFQELGYGRLLTTRAFEIGTRSYAISHLWNRTPIHLLGAGVELDRRSPGVAGAATASPHSLVQELLNRSDEHLWAFVSNGLRLRILRDNLSLVRQAMVEFDLKAIFDGDLYSEFALLWLICHQSRVEADQPEKCWLEQWSKVAHQEGARALDQLRDGVEKAIEALGEGFLKHPANSELKERLRSGQLDRVDYYRLLLRWIYRLIFLFVAEDRDVSGRALIFAPSASEEACQRYSDHYSTRRLREMADTVRGGRHTDLFEGLRLVVDKLSHSEGCPELGLAPLGGLLFSEKAMAEIGTAQLANEALLSAVRHLSMAVREGVRRPIDYRNLGTEELGSVYEALLEQEPQINVDAGTFALGQVSGSERKTTGSYYTPSSLVSCLLDSALDPVLDRAEQADDPERAILDLKVCDPACGSGHFLIAAAHRMARRLAGIRTEDGEPAPEAVRKALRDVIGHCLYGVDVNPMAVELCKVSLWIEAHEPGKPLSFLDHRILCGNSLLGTTPRVIEEGIPKEAFKPIEGDDRSLVTDLRKRNQKERKGQTTMWAEVAADPIALYGSLQDQVEAIDQTDDTSLEGIEAKEAHYARIHDSEEHTHARRIADAWCAAFLAPKYMNAPEVVTEDLFRRLKSDPDALPEETRRTVERIGRHYRLFHWHLAYPDVFRVTEGEPENESTGWSGGFDVVLGNPPWERIKLQEKEWFAPRRPEIAGAPKAAARRRMIRALKDGDEQDRAEYKAFLAARRRSEAASHLVRNSGRFPLCGRGDINTYSIFAEVMRDLRSSAGHTGCIVPSGIATDFTTRNFFQEVMKSEELASLYSFENEALIFPAVHHATKFCLMTLRGCQYAKSPTHFVFFLRSVNDLKDVDRHFHLTLPDINFINPNTGTCPIFRNMRDARIAKDVYRKVPILVKEGETEDNLWRVRLSTMFHMTNDSNLFRNDSELKAQGLTLEGNRFVQGDMVFLPLYEGKMIWHFDHRFGTYSGQSPAQARQGVLPQMSDREKASPVSLPLPQYWVDRTHVTEKLDRARVLAFRDITSSVVLRTAIFTMIPRVAVSNKAPLIQFEEASEELQIAFLCCVNSLMFDYCARQKIGGNSFNFFLLKQLPVPSPSVLTAPCPWDHELRLLDWCFSRGAELCYTSVDLRDPGGHCFMWSPRRRHLIRAELDSALFHLYEIDRQDVGYIMETFPVLKKYDFSEYGSYRTKETILEIYDRMQTAIETGEPYQTFLDPPPGDPSMTHLPEGGRRPEGQPYWLTDLLHTDLDGETIPARLDPEDRTDGLGEGPVRVRVLEESDSLPEKNAFVVLRHPRLTRGSSEVGIAAGKFLWQKQRDPESGATRYKITLRSNAELPATLELTEEEWTTFRPLAVLAE